MNLFIHSIMYSYFALKALRFRFPRIVPLMITTLQIIQMTVGLIVSLFILKLKLDGSKTYCTNNTSLIILATFVYILFLSMFINFFIKSYFSRFQKKSIKFDENKHEFNQIKHKIDENNNFFHTNIKTKKLS